MKGVKSIKSGHFRPQDIELTPAMFENTFASVLPLPQLMGSGEIVPVALEENEV